MDYKWTQSGSLQWNTMNYLAYVLIVINILSVKININTKISFENSLKIKMNPYRLHIGVLLCFNFTIWKCTWFLNVSTFFLHMIRQFFALTVHWCRFHQHFLRAFFVRIFRQSQNVTRKSCQNDVRTKNSYVKTLMKLTPVLRFSFIVDAFATFLIIISIQQLHCLVFFKSFFKIRS